MSPSASPSHGGWSTPPTGCSTSRLPRAGLADIIRTRIVPVVLPAAAKFDSLREWLFRTVSQVTINYRQSPLSAGEAGELRGGDRLPWVTVGDVDNYAPLAAPTWQVHVYGAARPELRAWCAAHDLPLHVFAWDSKYGQAGLAESGLYLLRPDTYIALADASGSSDALPKYFADRGIKLGVASPALH